MLTGVPYLFSYCYFFPDNNSEQVILFQGNRDKVMRSVTCSNICITFDILGKWSSYYELKLYVYHFSSWLPVLCGMHNIIKGGRCWLLWCLCFLMRSLNSFLPWVISPLKMSLTSAGDCIISPVKILLCQAFLWMTIQDLDYESVSAKEAPSTGKTWQASLYKLLEERRWEIKGGIYHLNSLKNGGESDVL